MPKQIWEFNFLIRLPNANIVLWGSHGAHCSHVNHVSTQLPYAITAAACSAVCYVITGLAQAVLGSRASLVTSLVLLVVAIVLELAVLSVIRIAVSLDYLVRYPRDRTVDRRAVHDIAVPKENTKDSAGRAPGLLMEEILS